MVIKTAFRNGCNFLFRLFRLPQMKPALLGTTLAVYAITGAISTTPMARMGWTVGVPRAFGMQDGGQCASDPARSEALQQAAQGFFKALRLAERPYYAGDLGFKDGQGKDMTLAAFRGKTLLVNLWAVWCGPCREEMPEFARLKEKLGGTGFDVVAINVDGSPDARLVQFLAESGAGSLALYRDRSMALFRKLRGDGLGRGLPLTLVLDSRGCLLASFNGAAPWGNEDAVAFIRAAMQAGR